jgi:hypothetical protein
VAKTLEYGRDLVCITSEDVRSILGNRPDRVSERAYFILQRDALMLWLLTHVHGPFIGNLALSKNEHLFALAASAEKLSRATCPSDLIGINLLDFDVERFENSGEVDVTKLFHAFRNGYRVVTNEALLSFEQYRRIFTSRFRCVYRRAMLRKEDSVAEAEVALQLLLGLFLTSDRPRLIFSLVATGECAAPAEPATLVWRRHAAAMACHFLASGVVIVDVVAAILGGKDCFELFHKRGPKQGSTSGYRGGLCA